MIEISKEEGKILNKIIPQYVMCTVHKRHYYMTECKTAFELLNKIEFVYNNNYYEDCENGLFLVNDYFLYRACYFEYPTDNSNSYLSIYSNYELQNVKTIHLDYLQFRSVTSAFSDSKGDIWLYVCQNSKYELLKLKLLE